VGIGLTSPSYSDWFKDFVGTLDADHPTCVVLMFGANDQQAVRDENHKGYVFRSAGWKNVYEARVNAVLAETGRRHIQTIWVGLPVMRSDDLNTGAVYLNQIYVEATGGANVTFVPLADTFKGPDGSFANYLQDGTGHAHLVRADDGIHFTPYGYEMIAAKVYAVIASEPTKRSS
jgi:hypothetical protein